MTPVLGIIGGSGVYEIEGLTQLQWETIRSPFGDPSDQLLFGELDGQKLIFLPRHGRGHALSPSAINYRANIDVLKRAGVTEILSLSAVGSFKEELSPGTFVVIDQFIDRTRGRSRTFFERGVVAHVSMAHPTCSRLAGLAYEAAVELGLRAVHGGTYVAMEGPQFSTLAESTLYKSWGCDVIGMTNLPEARLAREAELPYATLAMATDYDCWHEGHDAVTVSAVIAVMQGNVTKAKEIIVELAETVPDPTGRPAASALAGAIITNPDSISAAAREKLRPLIGKYVP